MRTMRNIGLAMALLLTVGALQSCNNPFGVETPGTRYTPTLSALTVSRSSVFSNVQFIMTFTYADPQNDITTLNLTLTGTTTAGLVQETISWTDTTRIDLTTTTGKARLNYSFDGSQPADIYSIKITVTDLKGHQSSEVTGSIHYL